uniref:Uncharacterized protein n=1 Tax=Anguilla anguilla TaxID=7936 RepID=A0A0E9XJK8_ANGAN
MSFTATFTFSLDFDH